MIYVQWLKFGLRTADASACIVIQNVMGNNEKIKGLTITGLLWGESIGNQQKALGAAIWCFFDVSLSWIWAVVTMARSCNSTEVYFVNSLLLYIIIAIIKEFSDKNVPLSIWELTATSAGDLNNGKDPLS